MTLSFLLNLSNNKKNSCNHNNNISKHFYLIRFVGISKKKKKKFIYSLLSRLYKHTHTHNNNNNKINVYLIKSAHSFSNTN